MGAIRRIESYPGYSYKNNCLTCIALHIDLYNIPLYITAHYTACVIVQYLVNVKVNINYVVHIKK